jgi:HlyD family secretion protein
LKSQESTNISKKTSIALVIGAIIGIGFLYARSHFYHAAQEQGNILTEVSAKRSYDIEIHTVGELEAMRSTSITSAIKGDLGKIIYLIADGHNVKANEILVKMDPTPFEEHIEDLKRQIREQQGKIELLERLVMWETYQVQHEEMAAKIEIETAELEINKLIYGDGPIEECRLKSAMQKSLGKFEELKSYADDLIDLQEQGFLNSIELKQAEKKLAEEEEVYLSAKLQYESFVNHTQPMQIKKAEAVLRRYQNKYEEVIKAGAFKIAKAQAQLDQSILERADLKNQQANAEQQMILTEIKAPTPGIVVFKEEFRNGQRRKPRVGDILIRNQPILDLPDLETMLVKTKVREIDLFKIKKGTTATIGIDAYPELRLQGKILSIGVLAVSDLTKTGDEKYFEVIVKMDLSDSRLRPGMTARVVLHADKVNNKFSIPVQAVFEFHKKYYCFTQTSKGCFAVPIEIGLSNEQWVEIKSGLKEMVPILLSMPPWSDVKNAEEIIGKNK